MKSAPIAGSPDVRRVGVKVSTAIRWAMLQIDNARRISERSGREQSLSIAREPDHSALLRKAGRQTSPRLVATDA